MSTIIIGSPDNPDRYVYNPESPRDTSNRVEPNRAPAQLPNIPDNLITDEMRLQNIIDNKNLFKNIPSPDREGMNVYQDMIQDFRTSTPKRGDVYTKRFPITSALENLANSGGIFGTLARAAFDQGKGTVSNLAGGLFPGAGETFRGIAEDFAAAPGGVAEDFKTLIGLKDDNPVKGEVREVLDVKKNTAEDIAPGSIFPTEDTASAGEVTISDDLPSLLPAEPQFEPGTLEFIQEQGRKNVEAFPDVLGTDEFGQAVLKKLGIQ